MTSRARPVAVPLAATWLVGTVVAGGAFGGATTALYGAAFAAAGVLAVAAVAVATRGDPRGPSFTRLEGLGLALVLLAALGAVPLPAAVIEAVAPYTADARTAAVGSAAGPVSLDAGATALAALPLAASLLLARAARRLVERGGGRALARATCVGVLVHGGAALWRGRYGEDDPLLLGWTVRNALNAWGTFPNRTQAAAFLLVGVTAAGGLLARPGRAGDRALGVLSGLTVTASVLASGSRAGVAGLLAALGLVGLGRLRRGRRWVLGIAAAAAAVAVAGAVGVGPLGRTLAWRAHEGTRFEIWAGTVDLARRQPVGVGWDAFPYAYPGDGRGPTDRWAGIAESDVLQAGVELGVPGVVLLALAVAAAALALRVDRRAAGPRGLPVRVALAGLVAAAPVALTGSPFHAPAVACAGAVAWAIARGLVRGHDGGSAPGYPSSSSEASTWHAS